MASASFPRQDLEVYKKDDKWKALHLNYAEQVLKNYDSNRQRMTRLYQSYNGVKPPGSLAYLEKRYGKQNISKYISYRVGRTKLSLLHGEILKRPLSATVETINSDAVSEKMKQMDFMIGAMLAKKELGDLKDKAGVDVMEGAPIPADENDPIWSKMSPKDKEEDIMQIILDEQMIDLDLKKKMADCFLDLLITSMCYCKIEIDQNGDVKFHRIDPRDAIYEEIQGDDYLERSPIRGCRQTLSVQEVLSRYELTKDERDKLDAAIKNPTQYTGSDGISRGYMRMNQGQLLCDVIHIEWDSVEPIYYKRSPKTKFQMEIDPTSDSYTLEMDTADYEQGKDIHDKNVADGKYQVETRYKTVTYEATRIGGCIDKNMRLKPFQVRSIDNPSAVLNSTYHGFIMGTVDGVRISIQQMIENFDNLYDIIQYQKNKDLARAKGKAMIYDLAGLPEGKKVKDILYELTNDGIVTYNSAAAGNFSGKNLDLVNAIKEIDIGLSNSLEYLMRIEENVLNQLDKITGINENREGQIAASSTVTNANSAIQASRTITEPIFFGMNGFVKKALMSVTNLSALSWAFYKLEKGEQILGTQKHKFLQVTKELGFKDFGLHIEDGSHYLDVRKDVKEMMSISLNAKEIRPIDAYKILMSETTAEMKANYENSVAEMQKAMQQSEQTNNQAQQQMKAMELKQQIDLAREDREDRQKSDADNILLAGQVQMQVDDNKAKNKVIETQHTIENDLLNPIS